MADAPLAAVLGTAAFQLEDLPRLLKPLLHPAPPIELEHHVRLTGGPHENVQCWDVTVQDPLVSTPNPTRLASELLQNDRQVATVFGEIQ